MTHDAPDSGSRRPRLPVATALMPAIPMVELPDGSSDVYNRRIPPCRRPGRRLYVRGGHGCPGAPQCLGEEVQMD